MKNTVIKIVLFLFIGFPFAIQAQQKFHDTKQSNVSGSDIVADAPWRMKKTNAFGNLNSIPLHIFIKDADVLGYNAELISLNVFIKNASDPSFGNPIVFNTYSPSAFLALFSSKSQYDPDLDIQSFDASLPVKDPNYTISFTQDTCSWPDNCTYTDITHAFWYFTINIPPDKLTGLSDIIDIRVDFSLNWQTDETSYVRVFRYNYDLPNLPGWERGDAHYHTMYTNNTAEYGLPLSATKEAAKAIGTKWITSTNHSCDYDNYGISMQANWAREQNEIQTLNALDSSMILIHAEEVSVNNSAGNTVHMLCYPADSLPYSMSYLGDGDGDMTSTALDIDQILYPLSEVDGFAYAAHPFAGGDKLSSLINGNVWNVGDPDFYANGTSIPGNDVVICNDLSSPSDLYSQNTSQLLFKKEIKGLQIWNCRNAMGTTDQRENPWNAENDGTTPFVQYDTNSTSWHWNRFLQNMVVTKFLNKKGLIEKNANPSLKSYRFYIIAGSDAHGSFNYSNTDFVMGLTADVHDNALGRLGTLVYCPSGMGANGEHVLNALKNGHAIMSDGPVIAMGMDVNNDHLNEFISGDEVLLSSAQYQNSKIHLQIANTAEFGNIQSCRLIVGTKKGEYPFSFNVPVLAQSFEKYFSLDSLVTLMMQHDTIDNWEYFYVRSEMQTHKYFSSLSSIYCDTAQYYHSFSNPVWIRKPQVIVGIQDYAPITFLNCFPNPFNNELTISFILDKPSTVLSQIFDMTGRLVGQGIRNDFSAGEQNLQMDTNVLQGGIYTLQLTIGEFHTSFKLAKLNDY